jgi:hypothetical protein
MCLASSEGDLPSSRHQKTCLVRMGCTVVLKYTGGFRTVWKISHSTTFLNRLQISRLDPFCREMICSDCATITISLHFWRMPRPATPNLARNVSLGRFKRASG